MFAAIAEVLHYYIDNAAREAFITTARRYSSVVSIGKLVDYLPSGASAARTDILVSSSTANNSNRTITAGTEITDSNGNTWMVVKDTLWPSGTYSVLIPIVQHERFELNTMISTQITNSSGNASYTYTGTGVGLRDIEVSYGKSVSGGNFLQEIFVLEDTLWYDDGTDDLNDIFSTKSNVTITRTNDGCTLTETETGTNAVAVTNTSHPIYQGDVFELDFMQVDGAKNYAPLYIRNKGNGSSLANITLNGLNQDINTWIHLKCQIIGSALYIYVNDETTPVERSLSDTSDYYRLYFNTPNTITTIRYKNLKVYSA